MNELGDLQKLLFANSKYSVLVVFQGMDASGKDGANRKVFRDCNPTGVTAKSFKKPTDEEFAHDFLWRVHKHAPPKGMIHIFNRSHYEDILIQRVHGWISEERVEKRMKAINAFEELLQFDNNTLVLKFYLHISLMINRQKNYKKELMKWTNTGNTIQMIGKKENIGMNTKSVMSMSLIIVLFPGILFPLISDGIGIL